VPRLRRAIATSLSAALLALAAASSASAATSCPLTAGDWQRKAPGEVGLDQARLQEALRYAMDRSTEHVAVYRHGCLVGEAATRAPDFQFQSYSMAKSVTSIAAGKAFTEHKLAPEDRVGGVVREADQAHGGLVMRHLLEMNTGLHWNFYRDYNVFTPRDRVRDALTLPFDHQPGTFFEYAQSPVALMAEAVRRATGEDVVQYLQRKVFDPIGIKQGAWSWERDATGKVQGFYGITMKGHDWARLGHLMLNRGRWGNQRILSGRYTRESVLPTPTNGGYGWYFWVNRGTSFVAPTADRRDVRHRRIVESAPPDMFLFAGLFEQRIIVIPSLGMVLVRLGSSGSRSGESDPFALLLTTASAELDHEFTRLVMRSITDTPVPDAGPYQAKGPQEPAPTPNYGFIKSAQEQDHFMAARNEPPLPPAGPPRARATHVLTQRVRVRRGRVQIDLFCPSYAAMGCVGPLELRDTAGTLLGRRRFRLRIGQHRGVQVTLNGTARRRLRRRQLATRATTLTEDSLEGTSNFENVTLLPPKRPRRPSAKKRRR
jgi:CubicO group peptidase (beta-lactamase class C family)